MIALFSRRRPLPIGIDIGSRSIKLLQLSHDRERVVDAVRHELPAIADDAPEQQQTDRLAVGLRKALEGRRFRGREAVVCLNDKQLFLQNVRVAKTGGDIQRLVAQEAASKVPFPLAEAEFRFTEAADVRQGETTLREVIVFACKRTMLDQALAIVDQAGVRPLAVDVEPAALARCYVGQCRRDEDRQTRVLLVHVGYLRTAAVIAQANDLIFAKYIEVGGSHLDAAIARRLHMPLADAAALRRNNGDRRADMQDPEIARSIAEATRPVIERLATELAMCARYHSVTFRGQALSRLVLGGGEASTSLLEAVTRQVDIRGELSDPFRVLTSAPSVGRKGQWDVATGLALRELT